MYPSIRLAGTKRLSVELSDVVSYDGRGVPSTAVKDANANDAQITANPGLALALLMRGTLVAVFELHSLVLLSLRLAGAPSQTCLAAEMVARAHILDITRGAPPSIEWAESPTARASDAFCRISHALSAAMGAGAGAHASSIAASYSGGVGTGRAIPGCAAAPGTPDGLALQRTLEQLQTSWNNSPIDAIAGCGSDAAPRRGISWAALAPLMRSSVGLGACAVASDPSSSRLLSPDAAATPLQLLNERFAGRGRSLVAADGVSLQLHPSRTAAEAAAALPAPAAAAVPGGAPASSAQQFDLFAAPSPWGDAFPAPPTLACNTRDDSRTEGDSAPPVRDQLHVAAPAAAVPRPGYFGQAASANAVLGGAHFNGARNNGSSGPGQLLQHKERTTLVVSEGESADAAMCFD